MFVNYTIYGFEKLLHIRTSQQLKVCNALKSLSREIITRKLPLNHIKSLLRTFNLGQTPKTTKKETQLSSVLSMYSPFRVVGDFCNKEVWPDNNRLLSPSFLIAAKATTISAHYHNFELAPV